MNRESRASTYLLLCLGGAALVLLLLPSTGKVRALKYLIGYLVDPAPYQGSRAVERLAELPTEVSRLIAVDAENRRLREQIAESALVAAENEGLRRENERLSAELGVQSIPARARIWARVMERDPANWHSSIMIAAGSRDGVEVNSPVLGLHGSTVAVIGRVTEVLERSSKVLLVTDPVSAVAAYVPTKGLEGLVQGEGGAKPRMNYLPVESLLLIGDRVATSPTSVTFPPDIPIGTISRIFPPDPFLAFQSVEVSPAVRVSSLKKVLVLAPLQRSQS